MIYLGSDHGGIELKSKIRGWLTEWALEYEDMGNFTIVPNDDYPDYAGKVAVAMRANQDRGILICRTGHGMVMSANRFPTVRAILAVSVDSIKRGRNDEDANVLAIAADFTTVEDAKDMVKTFLETPFSGGERHLRRINKVNEIGK